MRVYIVWVKGKKVTLKNPPGRMFRDYLTRRPYLWDTRENDSLAQLFSFQSYAPHMPFLREPLSRTSRELVAKCTDLHLSLSLHQLNTKPNIIKFYKTQGTKLKQLQHFLSWNKANIKLSCKSELYTNDSLGLGGLYYNPCTLTYSLVDWFGLEGHREVFEHFRFPLP